MSKVRTLHVCRDCEQQLGQWAGRCPGCGAWGTIEERRSEAGRPRTGRPVEPAALGNAPEGEDRIRTGFPGVDRVLGGGIVPGSVTLLAGEPGIGKSTLLLHVVAHLSSSGHPCLLVSGEESHAQVAARARRLGLLGDAVRFAPGRDLEQVLDTARAFAPALLAIDSIQTLRAEDVTGMPGGPSQVRLCTDELVGLAKSEGLAVLLTGHVTKDGDLAGPRTLEHAVDVVLTFDGDARSGLRILSSGKNRFGAEGETAWFEMGAEGLREIDPTALLISGERQPGAATALPQSGRQALAVEVQALVAATDGPARRQATGLDPRRFALVAAVLDRVGRFSLGRSELYGASSGGVQVDDPACDLAIAAALASAVTGLAPPAGSAFVGEIALTGLVRAVPAMEQRLTAARVAGCTTVFVPEGTGSAGRAGLRIVPVSRVDQAVRWALVGAEVAVNGRSP